MLSRAKNVLLLLPMEERDARQCLAPRGRQRLHASCIAQVKREGRGCCDAGLQERAILRHSFPSRREYF